MNVNFWNSRAVSLRYIPYIESTDIAILSTLLLIALGVLLVRFSMWLKKSIKSYSDLSISDVTSCCISLMTIEISLVTVSSYGLAAIVALFVLFNSVVNL